LQRAIKEHLGRPLHYPYKSNFECQRFACSDEVWRYEGESSAPLVLNGLIFIRHNILES